MENIKSDFIQQLRSTFPELEKQPLETLVAENLISPFSIHLPKSVLEQAQKVVAALFGMREKASYISHYQNTLNSLGLRDPGNKSIMMSYDFHVTEDGNLKLIEINTNAAFLALGHQMYTMKGHALPVKDFSLSEIKDCITTEMQLQGKKASDQLKVSITDENPAEQRLFVEFLVYNELFKSWGWDSRIQDYRDLFKDFNPDFIYNRYTDFFLTEPTSQLLREKFLSKEICLSPNPYEYFLLADKQRLIDWRQEGFLESHGLTSEEIQLIQQTVPLSLDLTADVVDKVWAERKKYFFKPKHAFGSKQSYKGASISRRTFDEMINSDMIAQEFVPAPEVAFDTPTGPQNFKYDLRCYAYQGRLQLVLARIYQGQVTNLRTPMGGFATTLFN